MSINVNLYKERKTKLGVAIPARNILSSYDYTKPFFWFVSCCTVHTRDEEEACYSSDSR